VEEEDRKEEEEEEEVEAEEEEEEEEEQVISNSSAETRRSTRGQPGVNLQRPAVMVRSGRSTRTVRIPLKLSTPGTNASSPSITTTKSILFHESDR
jgi:hypothetical protein